MIPHRPIQRTLYRILLVVLPLTSQAQVLDPTNLAIVTNQTTQISQALQMLKQSQTALDQTRQATQQLVAINQYMQNANQEIKQLGSIKDLQLNKLDLLLDKILCIKQGNWYLQLPNLSGYLSLLFKGFNLCDNTELFNVTWAGMAKQMNLEIGFSGKAGLGITRGQTVDQLAASAQALDVKMEQAYTMEQIGTGYNDEATLTLALKYKSISDDLMKTSQELSAALNVEGDKVIEANKSDRLQLMAKAMDYQLKALEYHEKYCNLLQQATRLKPNDKNVIINYKRNLSLAQILAFRK